MTARFCRFFYLHRHPRARLTTLAAAGLLGGALWLVPIQPSLAQTANTQQMMERIELLQRELTDLQRQVYQGGTPPAPGASAAGGAGTMTTTAAARIELRLSQFETELRALTGQVEETVYHSNQTNQRLERLAAEIESRLQRLEQGAPPLAGIPAGTADQLAPQGGAAGALPQSPAEPRILGSISQADLQALQSQKVEPGTSLAQPGQPAAAPQPGAQQAAVPGTSALSGATPEEQYRHAFGLLSQANYDAAERALRAFVETYPADPLAGNAKYWLGETYYVRQDYQQAAVTFAEAYQEYPDGSKAPDNLLKLGMSLSALGNQNDSCGTFAELLKRYPKAAVTVIQRAKQEQRRLACP